MRVFFDASIIIAALLSPLGGSAELFRLVKTGTIVGITSQTAIDEVLEKDKPVKLKRSINEIEDFIFQSGLVVRETVTLEEVEPYQNLIDNEDAHLIAGAKLTKCEYLVSLDKKHVLREEIKQRFLPLKIVTPKELIEDLVKD